MGFLDFFKSKKKVSSDLEIAMKQIAQLAFPGGQKQIQEESAQLHALLRGSLSKSDAKRLLTRIKALLVISEDKSEPRIIQSILLKSEGKLTPHQAKLAYQFFTGVSGQLYSGGNGSSEADAVVINATTSAVGIDAEYKWIEEKYGKQDIDWTIEIRFHASSDDGKYYDIFQINLKDGSLVKIVFDISSFYGQF